MDVNAAWNILYQAAGKIVLRRSGKRATNQRLSCSVLYARAVRKEKSTLCTYLYNSQLVPHYNILCIHNVGGLPNTKHSRLQFIVTQEGCGLSCGGCNIMAGRAYHLQTVIKMISDCIFEKHNV